VSVLLAMSQTRAKDYYFITSNYDKSFRLTFLQKYSYIINSMT